MKKHVSQPHQGQLQTFAGRRLNLNFHPRYQNDNLYSQSYASLEQHHCSKHVSCIGSSFKSGAESFMEDTFIGKIPTVHADPSPSKCLHLCFCALAACYASQTHELILIYCCRLSRNKTLQFIVVCNETSNIKESLMRWLI